MAERDAVLVARGSAADTSAGRRRAVAGRLRRAAAISSAVAAVAVGVAGVVATWLRLLVGVDLQDESYFVVVPWRWALGDRPFVHEQNLAQAPGIIAYPFVKLFGILRDYDVTGLVLYTRHLYLALMIAIAVVAFLFVRRLVRWELALLVATVVVTFIFWGAPQLTGNTMGAGFLTLGAVLAAWTVVLGRGPRYCLAAGVAFGLAVIAFPTLLFIMPFYGVALAFAMGRRAPAMVLTGQFLHPPDPEGPPTGMAARRAVLAWVLGGAIVLAPVTLYLLSAGVANLRLCWDFTLSEASRLDQLGGADKAFEVARGSLRFLASQPLLFVGAVVLYLIYRRRPRAGRALLAALPVALWFAGQREGLEAAGFVIIYALLTPYLYLFTPRERREQGAKLLVWVWGPGILAGAMVAYTSSAGYVHAAVGLLPAVVIGGLFTAWALEAAQRSTPARDRLGRPFPWLALAVLTAVVAVTIALQLEYQVGGVPRAALTKRFDFGPWWGIAATPEQYGSLRRIDERLSAEALPGDQLLVFPQSCGYYLLWDGGIAANSYTLSSVDATDALPEATRAYLRRRREVPTLVVHVVDSQGLTDAQLVAACGGLSYPVVWRDHELVLHRKPNGESVSEVLARLPQD